MNIFVCIGTRGEMMFSRRRVSFDSAVLEDIVRSSGGELFAAAGSLSLFARIGFTPTVFGEFSDTGYIGNYFVEDRRLLPFADKIDILTVYNFNRHYPVDLRLDINPEENGFVLLSSTEFAGTSHEKITKKVWKNENMR